MAATAQDSTKPLTSAGKKDDEIDEEREFEPRFGDRRGTGAVPRARPCQTWCNNTRTVVLRDQSDYTGV